MADLELSAEPPSVIGLVPGPLDTAIDDQSSTGSCPSTWIEVADGALAQSVGMQVPEEQRSEQAQRRAEEGPDLYGVLL